MAKIHVRSISMPSSSHPTILKVEEELQKLKATMSTASSSTMHMSNCLGGVGDIYDLINDLLKLSSINQAIIHPNNKSWLESELDASVRLLDLCGATKDLLSETESQIQDFQLRRQKCTEEMVCAFIFSNKAVQKMVKKTQQQLKFFDNKCRSVSTVNIDEDVAVVMSVLKEATETTVSLLNSVLSYLAKPKACKWSIFKRKDSRKVEAEEALDASTQSISFKEVESGLEALFRRVIKNRVSLLNFVSI